MSDDNILRLRIALAQATVTVRSLRTVAVARFFQLSARGKILSVVVALVAIFAGWSIVAKIAARSESANGALFNQVKQDQRAFTPTATQWGSLTIVPVTQRVFRSEHVTEGKIAVNDDRSTLIFSPYSGRVTNLAVKPGDSVTRGQLLFVIEAA